MPAPFQRVLIPLDGSPFAEHVLALLPRVATPAETELVLVSVIEPVRYAFNRVDFTLATLATYIRNSTQAYIDSQRERLCNAGYSVTSHVLDGDAAGCIVELAETVHAELIAMTTHGRSGFVSWALGSVAERVVQGANIPVLLMRQEMENGASPLRRILVPLDGSALAEQALPIAQRLARSTGAQLLLLQVLQELDAGSKRMLFANEAEADAAIAGWRADAEEYIQKIAGEPAMDGVVAVARTAVGAPEKVLGATIVDEDIDLVVMSTHGRTGLSRWYYGSIANKVLHSASCPLLLIRPESKVERQV
jgi:nucleotide-binding universal stress UspA family protein